MRWYEYKMEVEALHASDDLKARLLALQDAAPASDEAALPDNAAHAPGGAKKPRRRVPLRFPVRRVLGAAACVAVGVFCAGVLTTGSISLIGAGSAGSYSPASLSSSAENSMYMARSSLSDAEYSLDSLSSTGSDTALSQEDAAAAQDADTAKIIYTATLELESKDYDTSRDALEAALAEAGGYLESSQEYNSTGDSRSLSLTLRVPEEHYADFLTAAAESGNLIYKSESAEDVTAQYLDVAARLANLTAQRDRLQELQAQAETLADLLEIESSLSDVQYQIESWQSQLDWYDQQVDCCTVNVSLYEVQEYTPAEESFGERFGSAFANGWSAFVEGAQSVVVWLAYHWPILLLAAAIAAIVFWLRRRARRG